MNRFLTVIQYCLDISLFIDEMSRLMKTEGCFIIVLGRTSNVLGCSFRNGDLIRQLIEASGAFGPITNAERVFTNRFGERIYEDIIITHRNRASKIGINDVRLIAKKALHSAVIEVPENNRKVLMEAIDDIDIVKPSTNLALDIPAHFQ